MVKGWGRGESKIIKSMNRSQRFRLELKLEWIRTGTLQSRMVIRNLHSGPCIGVLCNVAKLRFPFSSVSSRPQSKSWDLWDSYAGAAARWGIRTHTKFYWELEWEAAR